MFRQNYVCHQTLHMTVVPCHRAEKLVARVPKMVHGKSPLARGIHSATVCFVFTLPDQRLYNVQNMCIYTHI